MEKSLLIEIGTEELPAIPLLKELNNIKNKWQKILNDFKLYSDFEFFYTPKRLVFFHKIFKDKQEDSIAEFIGAPQELAYKDEKITPAGLSFLKKAGINEDEIEFKTIKNKKVLYHQKIIKGTYSKDILANLIENFIKSLNFGKSMHWDSLDYSFIRPIRSISCVLGEDLIDFELFGIKSKKATFIHKSIDYNLVYFNTIKEYFELLKNNYVILDQNDRKDKITKELKELQKQKNIKIAKDEELLNEIVAITEYPKVLFGSFDKEFLQIPKEVIIDTMRENQRYFAVFDDDKLINHFVVVSNAICDDYSKIIYGNERVLRARLNDAMFFWKNDLQNGLDLSKLINTIYLDGLGTMQDKINRELYIAKILIKYFDDINIHNLEQAIKYAKADLNTQMVYEFTELQGIMGYYYALHLGFDEEICIAIKEQYLPNSENSALPSTKLSSIVALSNKIDILMGLFSIGKIPNGTKDPYALRRNANGILKIIFNQNIHINLNDFLCEISHLYKEFDINILYDFILDRLYTFYDINASFINAVLKSNNKDLKNINEAIKALMILSQNDDFEQNFNTFKRLANIAIKTQNTINEDLFIQKEEKELFAKFKLCKNDNIMDNLKSLFDLKPQIDEFFDKVLINVNDIKIKNNRQVLIYNIYEAFLNIADIKELSF